MQLTKQMTDPKLTYKNPKIGPFCVDSMSAGQYDPKYRLQYQFFQSYMMILGVRLEKTPNMPVDPLMLIDSIGHESRLITNNVD